MMFFSSARANLYFANRGKLLIPLRIANCAMSGAFVYLYIAIWKAC